MDDPAVVAMLEAEVARAEGRSDPEEWAAAARACEARGAAPQEAYALWRCADAALAGPQDRASAVVALRGAREIAQRLGARPLLEEIDGLARRARLELATAGDAPADEPAGLPGAALEVGLTARELEVLEHVALGQTNREIAAELFISARTAGVHVSHILEKLGASTRTEAATAAHRLGLVS
jgi:DNA-binding NarL/FixJ family response regulator